MNRRAQIKMSPGELAEFLHEERTLICATNGRDGWPHLMPLWYVVRAAADGAPELWAWTFAKSQKIRNLERDPRVTLQVETGRGYDQLRGVMIECETILHRDPETVTALGRELLRRYTGSQLSEDARRAVERQASKRVAMQFLERRLASWDHRKLGGAY
jgi:general stress protein 26